VTDLYFDDFETGQRFTTKGATLSEAQILSFAWQYDPQPFHIDAEAAKDSIYGGLIASGFQTMVTAFRLFYAEGLINAASLGSPGLDELRWLKPVRPGDTLHVICEIGDMRPSASKPDRGIMHMHHAIHNQHDEVVMTYTAIQIVARRPDND